MRRTRPAGSRRDVIMLGDDLWYEAFVDRSPLLVLWADVMLTGAQDVGPGTTAGQRLQHSGEFFRWLAGRFPDLLEEWRRTRGGA